MFKIGQRVVFVDDKGEGTVIEIQSKGVFIVEDEHGFPRTCPKETIAAIRISEEQLSAVENVPKEKAETQPKKIKQNHNAQPFVIDLHIHELVDRHEHWSNTEIVKYQMDYLKRELDKLMKKRVKIVHIVHGVGEGVLRAEVRQFLRKFANCEINDMSYTRNGYGATEFIIRYKGNV